MQGKFRLTETANCVNWVRRAVRVSTVTARRGIEMYSVENQILEGDNINRLKLSVGTKDLALVRLTTANASGVCLRCRAKVVSCALEQVQELESYVDINCNENGSESTQEEPKDGAHLGT